jgi:uncharacterized protein (TIGR02453 family)
MSFSGFSERTVRFLAELAAHNDKAWFEANAAEHEAAIVEPAKDFVNALGPRLGELDPKIHAIPRVRGSIKALERRRRFPRTPPPPPYKASLDVWFWSGKRRSWDNSGFFLRLTPTRLILATGMIEFQKETLGRYRAAVLDEARGPELAAVVAALRANGYVVGGESYKLPPRGTPRDHPRSALLKHRGVFSTLDLEHPPQLASPALVDFCFDHYRQMARLHVWLTSLEP